MPQTPTRHHRARWAFVLTAGVGAAVVACQEPAGLPPTLAAGAVSFTYSGIADGSVAVEGRCYWAEGYPAADPSCALAMDLGDTIRIRAVRDPRTIRWIHVNVEFPEDGECDAPDACRIAFDEITVGGKVRRSFKAPEATVSISEATANRLRGTFTGLAYEVDGDAGDTLRITEGVFDVPVER
jgi:hypothetical protein